MKVKSNTQATYNEMLLGTAALFIRRWKLTLLILGICLGALAYQYVTTPILYRIPLVVQIGSVRNKPLEEPLQLQSRVTHVLGNLPNLNAFVRFDALRLTRAERKSKIVRPYVFSDNEKDCIEAATTLKNALLKDHRERFTTQHEQRLSMVETWQDLLSDTRETQKDLLKFNQESAIDNVPRHSSAFVIFGQTQSATHALRYFEKLEDSKTGLLLPETKLTSVLIVDSARKVQPRLLVYATIGPTASLVLSFITIVFVEFLSVVRAQLDEQQSRELSHAAKQDSPRRAAG